ncbi:hypothetical protein SR39_07445 [Methylobacterium radiotolerans]|nr:hypothetical protein SR39_07445 [Methylobacterium radiotolerans]
MSARSIAASAGWPGAAPPAAQAGGRSRASFTRAARAASIRSARRIAGWARSRARASAWTRQATRSAVETTCPASRRAAVIAVIAQSAAGARPAEATRS